MIKFRIDHSHEEDYFYVEDIELKVDDEIERERIEKAIIEHKLRGYIGYPDIEYFALCLGVDKMLIDIDVDEFDITNK